MLDLVEILLGEHLAIKGVSAGSGSQRLDKLRDFHEYLVECHVEIEEKILFPLLYEHSWDDSLPYRSTIDRIISDHRLIDTLGKNLIKWAESGDTERFRNRIPLYFRLLIEHNEREEATVFGRWKKIGTDDAAGARKDAVNLIHTFGERRYMRVTGLTEDAFNYIFR